MERECDSLYREIEIVRAKLIRYDVDLSSQHGDTKEVARRVDKLKEVRKRKGYCSISKLFVAITGLKNELETPRNCQIVEVHNGYLPSGPGCFTGTFRWRTSIL